MARHVLGLDIGASKTHGMLVAGDRPLAEAVVGSASLIAVGEREAGRQLDALLERLASPAGVDTVCAGAAGTDDPDLVARLAAMLAERVPGARVLVVHDTVLLLAAARVPAGVALISGTGSIAWGRAPDGGTARAGGWGYLLGDEGSGYGLARDAVRHVLRQLDANRPADALTEALTRECGLASPERLLAHFYERAERRYWAHRAEVVFRLAEAGDPTCRELVGSAADALAGLVRTVCSRLAINGPVVCGGGQLTHEPLLVRRMAARLARDGIVDVRVLDRDPVHGAVALALHTP